MTGFIKIKNAHILIVALAIIFLVSDGLHVINYPPRSIHQWRQSDCAAYAKTYYQKNSGLFSPSTYNLAGKDGRTVSEFPIIYFVAAKLFHIFGFHYWILRGLTFLCYIIGLFYLLKCIQLWMRSPSLPAVLAVILLASTPYFYYYALNFLPNVPAICISFGGLYYMLRYERSTSIRHLIVGTLFFVFSTLLKPTDGGIIWLAWLCVWGVTNILKPKTRIDKKVIPVIISSLIIAASIYAWYKFATWYNDENGNHQNLLDIYPIWDMTWNDIRYVVKDRIFGFWAPAYQQRCILYFLGVLGIIYVVKWKSLDHYLRLYTLFVFIGIVLYDILWFKAFGDHDYYQLPNVLPYVFLIITVGTYYEGKLTSLKKGLKYSINGLLLLLIAISIYHNRNIQHDRYTNPEFVYINPNLYSIDPYLKQLGINDTATVICVPDPSPNMSLTAVSRRGYTESFNDNNYNINTFKQQGAEYLIISDSSYLHRPLYTPYTSKLIGQYKGIYIFDIR